MIHLHIFIVLENTWRRYGIPVCVTVQRRCWSAPPACWSAISTPPTTITTAPYSYDGPIQRCWAHLLRDIHDLQTIYPDDASVTQRAGAVQDTYRHATALDHHHQPMRRLTTQLDLERRLLSICQAFLDDPSAAQSKLCRRIQRHIKSLPRTGCGELFVFVAEPQAPPDNNAAERSLRHLVVSRKISGGTRSQQGIHTKMTLASLFGPWRSQGLNTLSACRQLLASPQV